VLRNRALVAHVAVIAVVALAGCGGAAHGGPAAAGAPRAPAPRTDLAAIAARAKVPVLCWHQIRRQTPADAASARPYIVSPRTFAAQIAALDRAGYTPISGDALADHVARGAPLPRKPVLLTFDDGSAGQWSAALPVLRRHRFKATFFVMTVVLGNRGWLTRGQVRALDRAGMTIAAHTWDHHPVPGYTRTDWPRQLLSPKLELTKLVGHPIRLFAYPYGLWSQAGIDHLRRFGFSAAFQLAGKLDAGAPLYTLRRIIVPQIGGRELLRDIRRDF
jgi:peptidoglycan/xylan/chitin deacetylase (PgdA/CDA1 family)